MTTRPSVGIQGLQGLGLAQAEIRQMEEISQSQHSKENKNKAIQIKKEVYKHY